MHIVAAFFLAAHYVVVVESRISGQLQAKGNGLMLITEEYERNFTPASGGEEWKFKNCFVALMDEETTDMIQLEDDCMGSGPAAGWLTLYGQIFEIKFQPAMSVKKVINSKRPITVMLLPRSIDYMHSEEEKNETGWVTSFKFIDTSCRPKSSRYTIPTKFVVDFSVYQSYLGKHNWNAALAEAGIRDSVNKIANAASNLLLHPSLSPNFVIQVSEVEIWTTQQPAVLSGITDASDWVEALCRNFKPTHIAHVTAVTADLQAFTFFRGRSKMTVRGVVPYWGGIGGMCSSKSCSAIYHQIGNPSVFFAFALAHEIGHSLGMKHDGDGNTCANDQFIMSPFEDVARWSTCSNQYISDVGCRLCLLPTGKLLESSSAVNSASPPVCADRKTSRHCEVLSIAGRCFFPNIREACQKTCGFCVAPKNIARRRCEDTSGYCDLLSKRSNRCTTGRYANYAQTKCRKTCGICV